MNRGLGTLIILFYQQVFFCCLNFYQVINCLWLIYKQFSLIVKHPVYVGSLEDNKLETYITTKTDNNSLHPHRDPHAKTVGGGGGGGCSSPWLRPLLEIIYSTALLEIIYSTALLEIIYSTALLEIIYSTALLEIIYSTAQLEIIYSTALTRDNI